MTETTPSSPTQEDIIDQIRAGTLPYNHRVVRSLHPDVVQSLLRRGRLKCENTYVVSRLTSQGQPVPGPRLSVTVYRVKQANATKQVDSNGRQEEYVLLLKKDVTDDTVGIPVAADPKVQEVIDTINHLYEDLEYQEVHITDIWTGTPHLSFDETQDIVVWMENEGILRFDPDHHVRFLDEYHPGTKKVFAQDSSLGTPSFTSTEEDEVCVQDDGELFVLLDLTADDQLSQHFVQHLFPYAAGDVLVSCDLEQAHAVLRLRRSMLTPMQRYILRVTPAIVGYTLKELRDFPITPTETVHAEQSLLRA